MGVLPKIKGCKLSLKKIVLIVVVLFLLTILYYVYNRMMRHEIAGDLMSHLDASTSGEPVYSCSMWVMKILRPIGGKKIVAAFVAFSNVATIYFVYMFFGEMNSICGIKDNDEVSRFFASFVCCFSTPIYIPRWYPYFYKNQLPYNAWHNDTFTLMRIFSLCVLIIYFRISRKFMHGEKVDLKEYVGLMVALAMTTWSKPSFFFGFAPTLMIFFLRDYLKWDKRKALMKYLRIGMTSIPACLIVGYQYYVEFYRESACSNANKVAIGLSPVFLQGDVLKKMICCYLVPVIVLFCAIKYLYEIKHEYYFIVTMVFINMLMEMFVYEDGSRMMDGNFEWGAMIANFLLFAISLYSLIIATKRTKMSQIVCREKIMFISAGVLVVYQFISGIVWTWKSWFIPGNYNI